MKKLSKILVLVLAVALICTGLVLAVSADTGTDNTASYVAGGEAATADLAAAIAAADAGTTVKLEGNCTLDAQVKINKDVTVDLNGYTLNLPKQNAFAVETAGITFTITGNGTINAGGTFIYSTATSTVNVKGTGRGIKINHTADVFEADASFNQNIGLIIYGTKAGTYNLENLDIVSDVFVEKRDNTAEKDENNQRAAMFRTDEGVAGVRWNFNRVSFYRDAAHDIGFQDSGAFIYIAGNNAKATINDSVIKNSGPLVNIAYMQGNTNPDHVFAEINNSHMEVILKDGASRVSALTCRYRNSERPVVGTMNLTNSYFGGNVYRLFYGIDDGLKVNADNSVLANLGANDTDGSSDTDSLIMRAGQLKMTNGSVISTSMADGWNLVMDGSVKINNVATAQVASITLEVGTRFNIKAVGTNSKIKWVDANGAAVDSSSVRIILDPVTDTHYPYVSTTDADAVSYNHLNADAIDMYGMEFLASRGHGNKYGAFAEKDMTIGKGYTDFSFAFQGSAKEGAFTDVTYGNNTMFKYWVSPIDDLGIGDSRTFSADPYMIFGNRHDDIANAIGVISTTKVAVFEMDIATDSEYGFPKMGWQTNARTSTGGASSASTFVTLNSNGTFTNAEMTDFNADVKLSLDKWNHVTFVVYTDATNLGAEAEGFAGQTYVYVNGELLGYYNAAYNTASGSHYIQGARFNVHKTSHIIGQSILVDNFIRRAYNDYAVEGEADGAAKSPESYLITDIPENVNPINANIQVNGFDYATLNDALDAVNAYNATSDATGIIESIELKGNVTSEVVVDGNAEIYHNGYTINVADDSYGFIIDADKYTFNEDYWYNAYWYNGELGNEEQMADDANYIKEVVKLGLELDHANLFTEATPDYNSLKIVTQDGWAYIADATEKVTALIPGMAEFEAAKANADRAVRFYPVITGVDMTYYIKNSDGTIYDGGLNNADATASLKALANGDTFVLRSNIALTESNLLYTSTADAPKVLNIDLAGNTLSRSVSGVLMQVGAYTTLNVYSSVKGGMVMTPLANNTGAMNDAGTCFVISDGQNNSAWIDASQIVGTRGEVTEAYINVGKFGDIPGSNMTVVAERAYYGFKGGENCAITVDGVTTIAPGSASATSVEAYVYDGDIFVKNGILLVPEKDHVVNLTSFSLAGNGVGASKNAGPRKEGFENFIITSYIEFENMIIINKLSGLSNGANNNMVSNNGDSSSLIEGGTNHKALKFKNVVTTGRLNPSNEATRTVMEGFVAAETQDYLGGAIAGTKGGIYNKGMTWDLISELGITDEVLAFNVPAYSPTEEGIVNIFSVNIANNGASVSGLANAYILPLLDRATVYEDQIVYVNWNKPDGNGVAKTEAYVKGSAYVALAEDAIPAGGTVALNALKLVGNKTWTGVPAAGTVINENVNITCGYEVQANVTGIKANLSLYSDFMINVYIPVKYAPYITVNGAALSGDVVTLGDAQYYRITERRVAKEASKDATFALNITEGDYTATKTVNVSITDYASVILAGDYSEADKVLMYYMLNYLLEAATYFTTTATEVEALINNEAYKAFGNQEISHEYANALEDTGLGTYFTAAGVVLEEAPAFVLVPAGNFAGTVTVTYGDGNVRTYDVAAGSVNAIKIEGMKIYNFCTNVNVTVTSVDGEVIVSGKINLDTYAKYHTENAESDNDSWIDSYEALPLIKALYDYVKVAEAYKAGTLVG